MTTDKSEQEFLVSFGGGIGADIWDAELTIHAGDIFNAVESAKKEIELRDEYRNMSFMNIEQLY